MTVIESVRSRQVFDSRGYPTVEVDVVLNSGVVGRAIVPSGASTGVHEALELRDKDLSMYRGKSVLNAVNHVRTEIAAALIGKNPTLQRDIDKLLIDLDGTGDKRRLGANAILGASLAVARAAAVAEGIPLYQHLQTMVCSSTDLRLPLPMVNIISGGLHAGGNLDMQDFLIMPVGAKSYSDAMAMVFDVYYMTQDELQTRGYEARLVADEGGFAPDLGTNEEALDVLMSAIIRCGYKPGSDVSVALDVASSHFYTDAKYTLRRDDRELTSEDMVTLLGEWVTTYPIVSIEDGLAEDDWEGWRMLTERLGHQVQLIGDDLFTTSCNRLQRGIDIGAANAILVKVNQIGTLSEALDAIRLAQSNQYRTVVSARSGETEDDFIADLAVGSGAGQIKIGSITRSERLAKYNQLLRIEEEIGIKRFDGGNVLPRTPR